MYWRTGLCSLIHIILRQNVSCLGRTQRASIPIQFRDHRRSLNCTARCLWGLVEQMLFFTTSIWLPGFFFFFFPIGAPRGKCLWKPAVMPRHCLIHFSQDMLFKSICSLGGGSWRMLCCWCIACWCQNVSQIIRAERGLCFFLTSIQMWGVFSHHSLCYLQSAR